MIQPATSQDIQALSHLAVMLWPNSTKKELQAEFTAAILNPNAEVFVYSLENILIGFAYCTKRYEYVEGATASPVGYLEGIFIHPDKRSKGFARDLIFSCQQWALKQHACHQFCSDCNLDNQASIAFHLKMGFIEANRIVCFCKNLK